MEEEIKSFDGKEVLDFLSSINAEEGKATQASTVPPAPKEEKPFFGKMPLCLPAPPDLCLPAPPDLCLPAPPDDSGESHHLKGEAFSEPVLPIDGLSPEVQDYIQTVTEAYGCPQEFVVVACFITAGIAAGKKVILTTNPYTNYPSDFVCLVGKPSRNKTGPLMEVTRPLRAWDKENYARYAEANAVYDKKSGDAAPVFHQRVTGDSSPESRNVLLAQGDMIVVIADELKSLIDSFGRYSKGGSGAGAEISQMLSIWSNVSFTINRKTEETKLVDDPALSIIGGIQPGPLGRTFGTDALMDSGFTQRFLFTYPPKGIFIKRYDRKQMSQEKREAWSVIIRRLFDMEPLMLRLSTEAERLYSEYADDNDIKADEEEDDYIGGMIQKMNIHVLRLAIMGHLLSEKWEDPVITGGEMKYAIGVADYFMRIHIERIYPLLKSPAGEQRPITNAGLIKEISKRFKVKSQNSLAQTLGVSQQYVNRIMNEK